MTRRNSALAVLLRRAQWMLDEAAFEVGGGRYSTEDREELAVALDELSGALRETGEQASSAEPESTSDRGPSCSQP